MFRFLQRFLHDERGTLFTAEWVFVATILVLGACSYLAAREHTLRGERAAMHRAIDR